MSCCTVLLKPHQYRSYQYQARRTLLSINGGKFKYCDNFGTPLLLVLRVGTYTYLSLLPKYKFSFNSLVIALFSGIGYAVSTLLASRGCKVIIADVVNANTTRNTIIKATGNTNVVTKHLNLSSLKSVRKFAEEIIRDEKKIDILVNNAGVAFSTENDTEDHLNTVMQINFFGAFLLTHLLIEPLKAARAGRVVFTGSSMAYLSTLTLDNLKDMFNLTDFKVDTSTGYMLYQNSKLCNILVAQEFGEKLRQYGIIVNCADPGIVRTKLFQSFAEKLIREFSLPDVNIHFIGEDSFGGARTTFHLACSDDVKETGQHFYCCRVTRKPKILENRTFCNEVWKITEELVKLKNEEKI